MLSLLARRDFEHTPRGATLHPANKGKEPSQLSLIGTRTKKTPPTTTAHVSINETIRRTHSPLIFLTPLTNTSQHIRHSLYPTAHFNQINAIKLLPASQHAET